MKKKLLLSLLLVLGMFMIVGCSCTKEESNNTGGNTNNNVNPSTGKQEYTYTDGKLTQIVDEEGNPKQTDFVIDGIILVGNRHEYREEGSTDLIIEFLAKQGYKKEGINKDFYLGEWIEVYLDTKYSGNVEDVKILITPHKTVEELEQMSYSKIEELAMYNGGAIMDYQVPDEDNFKYVGSGYVNPDFPEGKYDVLFLYKGKLAYYININETKEPAE